VLSENYSTPDRFRKGSTDALPSGVPEAQLSERIDRIPARKFRRFTNVYKIYNRGRGNRMPRAAFAMMVALLATALLAQTSPTQAPAGSTGTYQPRFAGDKAHSNAEAAALGYMRTVLTAQKLYKKKHGHYATSLPSLVNTGSFTKRMSSPDRGDYKVGFHGTPEKFAFTMEPKQFDADHRAFFADETGTIRAEDTKPATSSSPVLK
jgi:hypothetical protein